MSEAVIEDQKASKLALYRGLIALAWSDHELHPDEKETLHHIINTHQGLCDADRSDLNNQVDHPVSLDTIWADISNPHDRARLIDMANTIFQQDGAICDNERDLIETFQARHLASIDADRIASDLKAFTAEEQAQREKDREMYREWARQFSLVERVKAIFRRG